jgi:hypothetical protein
LVYLSLPFWRGITSQSRTTTTTAAVAAAAAAATLYIVVASLYYLLSSPCAIFTVAAVKAGRQ